MNTEKAQLRGKHKVAIIILAAPPLVLVLFNIGPGRWMNDIQDLVIGGHSLSLSGLAVLGLEFLLLWIVAISVKALTGRTVVEIIKGKK